MKSISLTIFIVALFFFSENASAQSAFSLLRTDPPARKNVADANLFQRIKIWFDGKSPAELAQLGIDITEGDLRKGVWFTSDMDGTTLQRVQHAGFRTEVMIQDVKSYYRNRIESAARNPQQPSTLSAPCGQTAPHFPMPAHFHHGSMGGFYTYSELMDILDSMSMLYPNLITTKAPIDATQSIEGNNIYYLKLSDNPNTDEPEPEVLYTSVHHAREPESVTQMIYYLWYLLENYNTDPEIQALVDNTEMYFVPCVNPDGYMYNELTDPGGGGMWRKNRRDNLDGEYGVDLNRNYGYNWGFDDTGSSPFTMDETYRGTSAFSEPETQALRNFTNAHQFRLALNYHTYGNHMVIPWGFIPYFLTPDSVAFDFYGHAITKYNQYHVGTGFVTVGYITNGNSDDWMYGEQASKPKIFSMTPEVGDANDGFWPDPSRIDFLSESNVFCNLTLAKLAGRYGTIDYNMPRYTGDLVNTFHFSFHQLGLDTTGTYTISITPISANILSTGSPAVISQLGVLQSVNDSVTFTLDQNTAPGSLIQYTVTIDNGWYTDVDTVTQYFGNSIIALSDDGTDLGNWNSAGTWDATTEDYVSPPTSITDSPFNTYQSNENSTLELSNPISLAGAVDAMLTFSAKWDIEKGFDYVQILASVDGGASWTALCGKYTVPGTPQQLQGEPLYDGNKSEWVKEEISLNDFLGQNVLIRFQLVSDGFAEYDGFYFDDLKIEYINALGTNVPQTASELFLSQPVPNPAVNQATVNYCNVAAGSELVLFNVFGQLIWKQNISGTGKALIPTAHLSSGIYSYFIELPDGTSSRTMKMLKN